MGANQPDQLTRMANQIADNMSAWGSQEEVVEKIAEHLRKFWTPAMCLRLHDQLRAGEASLEPLAERALEAVVGTREAVDD